MILYYPLYKYNMTITIKKNNNIIISAFQCFDCCPRAAVCSSKKWFNKSGKYVCTICITTISESNQSKTKNPRPVWSILIIVVIRFLITSLWNHTHEHLKVSESEKKGISKIVTSLSSVARKVDKS